MSRYICDIIIIKTREVFEPIMNKSLFDNLDRCEDAYNIGVDYAFLEAHKIEVVKHQPWQLGLFHPDLRGKVVWYPNAGTLVYEGEQGYQRIGEKGDFTGRSDAAEAVYEEIMNLIIK